MNELSDDESTDDEFGVNLQLTERLRLNRRESNSQDMNFENSKEFKQYCNMRKKELSAHGGGTSSSSSNDLYLPNGLPMPETPSPYLLPNKKRQIVDKSQEQFANPKRTCLSDRFSGSLGGKGKKKGSHSKHLHPFKVSEPKFLYPERHGSERNLSPDKTYEHMTISDNSDSDASRFYKTAIKQETGSFGACMNSFKNRCLSGRGVKFYESDSDESTAAQNGSVKDTSSSACTNSFKNKCSGHGAIYAEGDSDESSKSTLQNGALKGGKCSSDHVHYTKKVIGRRNKILDSDESEDENWHCKYRNNRPLYFSSSESDDSRSLERDFKGAISSKASSANHSFPFGQSASDKSPNSVETFQPSSFKGNSSSSATGCQKESRNMQGPNVEQSPKAHRGFVYDMVFPTTIHSNNIIIPATRGISGTSHRRGRSNRSRGVRHSHRSGSPHPQVIHTRSPSDLTQSMVRRRTRSSRKVDGHLDLRTSYPDLFDAEDSSEVEFFTANSYSDTETSNESLCRPTVNSRLVSHAGSKTSSGVACNHNVNVESSEDEISVIFSTASHTNTSDHRSSSGTRGRRYTRGSHSHGSNVQITPDVISLSPDPVEQVRQMEEDEEYARMLQAQFDAEVDPDYTPGSEVSALPFATSQADGVPIIDSIARRSCDRITTFPPPSSSDSDDEELIDPVGDTDSVRYIPPTSPLTSPPGSPIFPGERRPIMSLYSRGRMQAFAPRLLLFNNRRPRSRSRNRRSFTSSQHDPWMWQFTRILGFSQTITSNLDSLENEYETLLELAEANGEAVQRGLQKSEINRLPTRKYLPPNSARSSNSSVEVTHKRAELNKECQVCLNDYEAGDVLRILPCFHEFHTPCIDPWLKINHTCPVCRVTVDLGE